MVIYLFFRQRSDMPFFKKYGRFNIYMPSDFTVHGIDVSHHNSIINFGYVKKMNVDGIKLRFVFIKATEGTSFSDALFNRNWKEAKKYAIHRGAYHFFRPGVSGKAQAKFFIRKVKLQPGDLPPVLDIEQFGNSNVEDFQKQVEICLNELENYYDAKPMIYASVSFYKKYLGDSFDQYPLWIAHYTKRSMPQINRDWAFWQHSERGTVDGINTRVDFNVFNGDSAMLARLLVK